MSNQEPQQAPSDSQPEAAAEAPAPAQPKSQPELYSTRDGRQFPLDLDALPREQRKELVQKMIWALEEAEAQKEVLDEEPIEAPEAPLAPPSADGAPAKPSFTMKDVESMVDERTKGIEARIQAKEMNNEMDLLIKADPLLSSLDGAEKTIRKQVIVAEVVRGKTIADAVKGQSESLAKFAGEERSKYLAGKIKDAAGAVEGSGPGAVFKGKKLNRQEVERGALLARAKEYLAARSR